MNRDDERVGLHLDLRHLSTDELGTFQDQAAELAAAFAMRPGTADLFTLIGLVAQTWEVESRNGRLMGVSGSAPPDPTAPLSHQVDDIARVMSEAMQLQEDARLSPALRGAWNDVLRNLAREVRDRYGRH